MRGIVICRRTRFQNTRGVGAKYVGVMTGKAGGKLDPSRCGGHKNLENAATFSKLLGQEDKLSPAPTVFRHARGAAGKRYDRGLTGEAGHGVPGVLLPSQPRYGRQPTITAPTTSRHITKQARSPEEHFHPPETKPPSQYRQNTPITTTIPLSGGRNCTGRVKTSPKKGAVGERSGSTDKKGGEKFRPGRYGNRFHAEE